MNITKGDVQELRRRLKKTECTFGRLCGCYVNSGKQIVTKFTEQFSELEEDEYYKYLEIAKKTFSGTLGANLLELEFDRSDSGIEHQKYLLTLKDSKLANEELLDRLYEQVIEEYSYPGNYLIVVYHDVYDVPSKATSGEDQDESTELYAYCVCAVCPVELAKPALGYREDENRIGARERDWVVGLPDLGFVYPAFANRGSDVNAVMYYVKTGRPSHPEFIENVLGCVAQRTAAEDKLAFKNVVHDAFGEDEEQADAEVPDSVRAQIEKSYEQVFGDQPPQAHNVLDSRLVEEGTVKAHTAALEQKVAVLQQELAHQAANAADTDEDDVPWETGTVIDVRMPQERAVNVHTEVVEGQKCLVIPLTGDESARINGVEVE